MDARPHLSRAEIDRLISGETGDDFNQMQSAMAHLDGCRECRMQLLFGEAIETPLTGNGSQGPCPDDAELQSAAAGSVRPKVALNLLRHCSQCGRCAEKLKEYAAYFGEDAPTATADLQTSDPRWQRDFARRLAASQGSSHRSHLRYGLAGWALAATLLIAVSAWFLYQRDSIAKVDRLVAAAFSESRSTDLRLPGAGYSEARTQRGVSPASSQPLAEARAAIEHLRPKMKDQASFLDAEARADLASNDVESAYERLKRANSLDPASPEILSNLAFAECLLADSGQTERYQVAYDLLSKALEKAPDNRVALYNRAIVAERLREYNMAVADWKRLLELEPRGEWADEARKRKATDEEILKKHSRAPTAGDPQTADAVMEGPILDLVAGLKPGHPSAELSRLADTTYVQLQDPWLRDLLAASGVADTAGLQALARAHRENAASDHARGLADANLAVVEFTRSHNRPALLRAQSEIVYGLHRSGKGEECLSAVKPLIGEAGSSHYWWLQGFATVEAHVCTLMVGNNAIAEDYLRQSERIAREHNLKILAIRLVGMRAGMYTYFGDFRQAAKFDLEGLDEYWRGDYPPIRGYQFYSDLYTQADKGKLWYAALSAGEESLSRAHQAEYRYAEIATYDRQALAHLALNRREEAFHDYDTASRMLQENPNDWGFVINSVHTETRLADVTPSAAIGATRLEKLAPAVAGIDNIETKFDYFGSLGRIWMRAKNFAKAEDAYRQAVLYSNISISRSPSELKRTERMHQTGPYFRGLITSLLEQGKQVEALEIWEQWRGVDLDAVSKPLANDPAHPPQFVRAAAANAKEDTFVSYFRLPDGLGIWVFDDRGMQFTRVNVEPAKLDATVAEFVKLCSDPDSDVSRLQTKGAEIYSWFVQPIERLLVAERTLVVLPEAADWNLPFAALRMSDGHYLSERFRLAQAPGFAEWLYARSAPTVRASDTALIVASPGGTIKGFAALPETVEEARALATMFPNSTTLTGSGANANAVTDRMRQATVFHYGGHALVNTSSGALVLPSRNGAETRFDPATLPPGSLRNLRLVVLAGCSTGLENKDEMTPVDSMSREFVRAGVPNVVAAHWAVDSAATSVFMKTFYSTLLQGTSTAGSVRKAALDLLHSPRTSHPYFWAAFTTYGRG